MVCFPRHLAWGSLGGVFWTLDVPLGDCQTPPVMETLGGVCVFIRTNSILVVFPCPREL